ncbi:hypothetical protein FGO68_gene5977 [Halteria grandinella]|uniref:Uncharacterized protein n=1 Tax=Halteria grandinella TaxID=5974 RepID=A0A8J8NR52_HALGN|nr:hypothetical protein FGO68_gene5977 [Halteria grandinella]
MTLSIPLYESDKTLRIDAFLIRMTVLKDQDLKQAINNNFPKNNTLILKKLFDMLGAQAVSTRLLVIAQLAQPEDQYSNESAREFLKNHFQRCLYGSHPPDIDFIQIAPGEKLFQEEMLAKVLEKVRQEGPRPFCQIVY